MNPVRFLAIFQTARQRLQDIEEGKETRVELTEFQRGAYISALRIIDKDGGVIISDSTGLGKTHIGFSLLRELASVRRQKVLLIAPRQVVDGVWEPRLTPMYLLSRQGQIPLTPPIILATQ